MIIVTDSTKQVKSTPQRRCVACRQMIDKHQLIRVSKQKGIHPEHAQFELDITGKAPGRGAYVCKVDTCIQKALKTKGFDRSYRRKVDPAVYERLTEWASQALNIEVSQPPSK